MPLYEYECEACGHRFEKILKFSDPPLEICPTCGGKIRKLQSSPAFQFKGSGWYVTDYARKEAGGGAGKKGDGGKDATGQSEGEKKSEKGEKAETSEKSEKAETKDTGSKSADTPKTTKSSSGDASS